MYLDPLKKKHGCLKLMVVGVPPFFREKKPLRKRFQTPPIWVLVCFYLTSEVKFCTRCITLVSRVDSNRKQPTVNGGPGDSSGYVGRSP